jgi:hypothetical protein
MAIWRSFIAKYAMAIWSSFIAELVMPFGDHLLLNKQ